MPRLAPDQWAAMRLEWEGEPTLSLAAAGRKYGVDDAEVSRRARREGWTKRNQLAGINESAHRRADSAVSSEGTQRKLSVADLANRIESESVRAEVLIRHRKEWSELEAFRKVALKTMKDAHDLGDRNAWSIAKTAADTALANMRALEAKQEGERKSWGLDAKSEEEIIISNPRKG